jgi:hypothetical protein
VADMLARLGQHREKRVVEEAERVLGVVQVVDDGQVGVLGLEVLLEFFPGLGGEFLRRGVSVGSGTRIEHRWSGMRGFCNDC